MKIKKFNTVLAVALLAGGLFAWSVGSKLTSAVTGGFLTGDQTVETGNNTDQTTTQNTAHDPFSEIGKDAQVIPWQSIRSQMPPGVVLKKWSVGSRTYYQASGPAQFGWPGTDLIVPFDTCSVYFPREGADYDEWIVTARGARVLHYHKDFAIDNSRDVLGESPLPSDRYRVETSGNQFRVTFWCQRGERPGNIVVAYHRVFDQFPSATTARHIPGIDWDHHRADRWTYP